MSVRQGREQGRKKAERVDAQSLQSKPRLVFEGMPDLLPMLHRSPGAHVSGVINYLCVQLGHYNPDSGRDSSAYMGLGCALEHAIIQRFALDSPGRYIQLGELEQDGLHGTPDLMDVEHPKVSDVVVTEIKLTWMSSRHEPTSRKFWKYWTQVMAYCYMLDTRYGCLHVCHVNGDYGANGQPTYRIYEREFTQREVEGNWKMLLNHVKAADVWLKSKVG